MKKLSGYQPESAEFGWKRVGVCISIMIYEFKYNFVQMLKKLIDEGVKFRMLSP